MRLTFDVKSQNEQAAGTVQDLATQVGSLCRSCVDLDDLTDRLGLVSSSDQTVTASRSDRSSAPRRDAGTPQARTGSSSGSSAATSPRSSGGSAAPSSPSPSPQPTRQTDPVGGLVDPIIGGLLGDDEQPGLVPGITGPLLGSK